LQLDCGVPLRTARDLLCAIVEEQREAFRLRKQEAQLLQVLSADRIAEAADTGRIISGGQDHDARLPALPDAIAAAVQAFEDGFYFMFVNDVQIETLDHPVDAQGNIDVLFIRLTPLVGG
jgi:hypothetical protein